MMLNAYTNMDKILIQTVFQFLTSKQGHTLRLFPVQRVESLFSPIQWQKQGSETKAMKQ